MDKIYIGTNWKMTKTLEEGLAYCYSLVNYSSKVHPKIDLFVIPSFTSLYALGKELSNQNIRIGAQNMHWLDAGPYTGEISPRMLAELKIDLVELGHSERRQYYNENDLDLSQKVFAALMYDLTPLLCVGENREEKLNERQYKTIKRQLNIGLSKVPEKSAGKVQIAYEPVWAIGENGIEAETEYVESMHLFIRQILVDMFGETGQSIPILFGGSVNEGNYLKYLSAQEVNGLFIGRSAWNMDSFSEILFGITQWIDAQ